MENWIEKLVKRAFEKAKDESNESNGHGLSNWIIDEVDKKWNEKLSERNMIRYYQSYVLDKAKKRKANKATRDLISKYLGYTSFEEFIKKNESEIDLLNRDYAEKIKSKKRIVLLLLLILTILVASLLILAANYYKKNCMIWKEDHYEKVRCSSLVMLDEVKLEKFKMIKVCDTTTFFRNGEAVIWYDKSNNILTYFTHSGIHPINKKTLKPITDNIIRAHVKPCAP